MKHQTTTFILVAGGKGPAIPVPEPTYYPEGTPIDVLLDAPIHGNTYSDWPLTVILYKYAVEDTNPLNKRRAAIRKIDTILGSAHPTYSDQETVDTFMKDINEIVDEIKADPWPTEEKDLFLKNFFDQVNFDLH